MRLQIPVNFNLIALNEKQKNLITLFVHDENHYIKIFGKKYEIRLDNETNNIEIFLDQFSKITKGRRYLIRNYFFKYLNSINYYFFKKIKIKGKGYRIRYLKKNKIMKMYFGYSHTTVFKFKKIKIKKLGKYKFLVKSKNYEKLCNIVKNLTWLKKFNKYTQRGIRCSREIIFKKKGKKSSYI